MHQLTIKAAERERPENKVGFTVLFFSLRLRSSVAHVYHAIHHNFTTKKPPAAPHFSRNTPQNSRKTAKTPEQIDSLRGSLFFRANDVIARRIC
jgi:hypothetical protein